MVRDDAVGHFRQNTLKMIECFWRRCQGQVCPGVLSGRSDVFCLSFFVYPLSSLVFPLATYPSPSCRLQSETLNPDSRGSSSRRR